MAAWRREFVRCFPSLQAAAQSAQSACGLMPRPLFFLLKEALEANEVATTEKVVEYALWLLANDAGSSTVAVEEDLLEPIMLSERLRAALLRGLSPTAFALLKVHCIDARRDAAGRAAGVRALEREYAQMLRPPA